MEIHHIKARADGGEDTFENAIPLCFDCHAIVRQYDPKHPKGIKFTESELKMHRDKWYQQMQNSENNKEPEPLRLHHQKEHQNIMLIKVNDGNDLIGYIEMAQGIIFSQDAKTRDEVNLISEFVQYIKDLMDYDLLDEPCDKIMSTYNLSEQLNALDDVGFWVFTNIEKQRLTGGNIKKEEIIPVLILRIVRKNSTEIIKVDMTEHS